MDTSILLEEPVSEAQITSIEEKQPRISLDDVLRRHSNAISVRDISELHILLDTCSVKRIPLDENNEPFLDLVNENTEYKVFTTGRIRGELARLTKAHPTKEMGLLIDYYLNNTLPILSSQNRVPELNKLLIEAASIQVQKDIANKKIISNRDKLERAASEFSLMVPYLHDYPLAAQYMINQIDRLFTNYNNIKSLGSKAFEPIGIADVQMIDYAFERTKEDKQTIIISDDSHVVDTIKYLRNTSKGKVRENMFAFRIYGVIKSLYSSQNKPAQKPNYAMVSSSQERLTMPNQIDHKNAIALRQIAEIRELIKRDQSNIIILPEIIPQKDCELRYVG